MFKSFSVLKVLVSKALTTISVSKDPQSISAFYSDFNNKANEILFDIQYLPTFSPIKGLDKEEIIVNI